MTEPREKWTIGRIIGTALLWCIGLILVGAGLLMMYASAMGFVGDETDIPVFWGLIFFIMGIVLFGVGLSYFLSGGMALAGTLRLDRHGEEFVEGDDGGGGGGNGG